MAKHKKSKNRKTRAQKIQQGSKPKVASQASDIEKSKPEGETAYVSNSNKTVDNDSGYKSEEDIMHDRYVRYDIQHSLLLVGIVLAVFVLLWILFEKTSVATMVTQIKL